MNSSINKQSILFLKSLIVALLIIVATDTVAAQNNSEEITLTEKERSWIVDHPTITAGSNIGYAPFDFVSAGEPVGLSIDYLNLLTSKVGLKVDYVNYGSWSENLKMAMDQKIDVLHSLSKTEGRQVYFTFSDAYIKDAIVLWGRAGSEKINNITDLNDKRIGIIKGHFIAASYQKIYPDLKYVTFNNNMEILRALASHEIDVYPNETMAIEFAITQNNIQGIEILGNEFIIENNEIDQRIAVQKNNSILVSIITKAIASVSKEEFATISTKWVKSSKTVDSNDLTIEEQNWLAENNTIKVAVSLNSAPYEFLDEQSNIGGITGSFLKEISKILNVKFVWSGNTTWNDGLSKLQSGDAEIASYATLTPDREKYLIFADSYLRDQQVIFAREDQVNYTELSLMDGAVIVQTKGSAIIDFIKEDYPNITIREVNSNVEALKLVSIGEADAFISSIPSTSAYFTSENINNVRVTGSTPYNVDNRIAVRSDLPLLFSSIQKALMQIDQNTRNGILSKGLTVPFQRQVDYEPLIYVIILSLIGAGIILIWNKQLRKEINLRQMTELELKSTQKEMAISLKETKDANAAKSDFLASMSHDLRTPLNAVIGFSEVLLKETFGPINNKKNTEYINDIHSSGEYLLHLVNDILDLSILEAGKRELSYEKVDGRELILQCKKIVYKLAADQNVKLVVEIKKNLPEVYVDKKAFMQIIMNLISNSIKFTPQNGVITITADISKNNHCFKITDTGCGISKEDIKIITKPFTKAESSPFISHAEGTGLGLSIVKSLVGLHGGELKIESILGEGTT